MIQAKCIQKFRDNRNNIYGYRLIDINGAIQDVYADRLKMAIKNKQIHIVNLKLTSDDRLVDTNETILQNHNILGASIKFEKPIENHNRSDILKGKTIMPKRSTTVMKHEDRLRRINTVSNEYATELIFSLAEYFSISIQDVLNIFDRINYWNVINDDETCCLLAHDGIKSNIKELEGIFYEILSRN